MIKQWTINVTDRPDIYTITERRPNEREDICSVKGKDTANLIAAAPALLQAAQEFYKVIQDNGCLPDIEQQKIVSLFYIALNKAKP